MTYDEIAKYETRQTFYYPVDVEQRLILCAQSGNAEQLKQIFTYVLDENLNSRTLSNFMIRRLFEELKGTLLKIAQLSKLPEMAYSIISKLDYDEALENQFSNVEELFVKICENESQKTSNRSQPDIHGIIEYIRQNYSDPNLSLASVASEFQISESYLSIFFKKKTGMNFIKYMEKLRMKEADRLLQDTNLSITEIGRRVGYNSAQSFRRAFKRMKGVIPNSMRNG